jgi:hypothetical protein
MLEDLMNDMNLICIREKTLNIFRVIKDNEFILSNILKKEIHHRLIMETINSKN